MVGVLRWVGRGTWGGEMSGNGSGEISGARRHDMT